MLKPLIAVLIDAENIPARLMPDIMRHVERLGDPIVRCAFGDFSANRLSEWVDMAQKFAMEIVFQPSGGRGKNSTDIAIAVRAMDLFHDNIFSGLCLVSSDRDFRPLAQRLVRSGTKVYGLGDASASAVLRAAYTDFFVLESAPARKEAATSPKSATVKPAPAASKAAFSALDLRQVAAIIGAMAEGETSWLALPAVASAIRREAPELASRFCGPGKVLKNLRASKLVIERGEGSSTAVRLADKSPVPIRAA